MADIRQKIIKNATPHLQPGETPIAAFVTQTKPWWWMLMGLVVFVALNRYQPVVVTDRRIIVFDSGRWMTTKAKSIVREAPRNIAMGPASGLWYTMNALGEPLQVHKRFHKDIAAADASIASQLRPPMG